MPSGRESYADAARRLEGFGNVPELAFALLGQGRTLIALARPDAARERDVARRERHFVV